MDVCACVSEKKKDIRTSLKRGLVVAVRRERVDVYVFVCVKKLSETDGYMGALYCDENSMWHYVHLL